MNYLAHAYLSFGSEDVLVGNMISDYVKGRGWEKYPPGLQKGIRLHRKIDLFTDTHPVGFSARKYLAPAVGRYSGVFLDIVYDHFLATDPARFTPASLVTFSGDVYRMVRQETFPLPPGFLRMFAYMESQDWLSGYAQKQGIRRSLEGMVRRAKYLPDGAPVYACFEENYQELKESYRVFFPQLEAYAREEILL